MLPDPYNCTHAQTMAEDPFIKAGAIFQVFIACLTMLPFLFMLKHRPKSFRRISNLASTNLKVVFFAGIIFVLVHSIGIVLFKTFSMVRALMAEDECDFRWSTLQCLCFKIPIYWTVFGFSCLHLALFFDRFLATFCGNFLHKLRPLAWNFDANWNVRTCYHNCLFDLQKRERSNSQSLLQ
ncbi:hypothetical protein M3Y97_00196200 [Aphelenchoides bicaudatus]|nr:hypothetical protein M3Y97_00196200 [Aphelenchoides bicaudatus]